MRSCEGLGGWKDGACVRACIMALTFSCMVRIATMALVSGSTDSTLIGGRSG
jgi:hypothetical protein